MLAKTENGKEGEPAAAQVRTVVGSRGKPQHIRPEVSPDPELCPYSLMRVSHVSVYDQRRRKGQRVARRNELHKRVEIAQAAVASAVANSLA